MKTTKYRAISFLLIVLFTVSILAGCSSGGTGDNGETPVPSTSANTATPTAVITPTPTATPTPTPPATSTPSPTPEKDEIRNVSDIVNGDVTRVQFGAYVWSVLSVEDGKALIITEDIIEKRVFSAEWVPITWEKSDTRKYLNGDFYNTFSAEEKALIFEKQNENPNNQWFGTPAGNATKDKVFLLSLDEVVKHFGDSGQLANKNPDDGNKIDDAYNAARIAKHTDGTDGYWWLRTFGDSKASTAVVDYDGKIGVDGAFFISEGGGVRPALWLKLQ